MTSLIPEDPLLPYPTHLSAAAGGALIAGMAGLDSAVAVIGIVWIIITIAGLAYHREAAKDSGEVKIHE